MARTHFLVHLLDSAVQGGVTVLFVCVMGTCARIVPHPDAEVFDGGGVLLEDLIHSQNLTIGLLHTSKLLQEVPASGKATRLTMCLFEIRQQRRRRQFCNFFLFYWVKQLVFFAVNVPKLGLCLDIVPSPELHSVDLGRFILLGGQMTPHNLELTVVELHKGTQKSIISFTTILQLRKIPLKVLPLDRHCSRDANFLLAAHLFTL